MSSEISYSLCNSALLKSLHLKYNLSWYYTGHEVVTTWFVIATIGQLKENLCRDLERTVRGAQLNIPFYSRNLLTTLHDIKWIYLRNKNVEWMEVSRQSGIVEDGINVRLLYMGQLSELNFFCNHWHLCYKKSKERNTFMTGKREIL